jgi:L-ascorbate metabolism protein UlaG (beta-lactamase superfamily)
VSAAVIGVASCGGSGGCDRAESEASHGQSPSSASSGGGNVMGSIVDAGPNDAYALPQAIPMAPDPRITAPMHDVDHYPTRGGELTITPIHHATFLIEHAGQSIYLDPVHEGASYAGLPKADFVFITHTHPDHMDPAGVADVAKDSTVVVGPSSVRAQMPVGIVLDNGGKHDFGSFSVEAVPAYNLKRGPSPGKLFHERGAGNGYIFTFNGSTDGGSVLPASAAASDGGPLISRIYVSGDTECTPEMKALKNIDIAFVCMNLPYTMPPEEAAACVDAFKPRIVYPYHYKGSSLDAFSTIIKPKSGMEIKPHDWYAK